ncbi:SART-1 protein [Scheffersomyces xylosifermentans]|uniref:SART-1 protein n=1 Tax=Scheffersomyces xylosifermentans TaxID=1304137 RepID=UPI00315CFA66
MEEISLSIEETNKLRISLGLKPIPVPDAESSLSTTKSTEKSSKNDNIGSRQTQSTAQELSIEETNRLRISLGLKPIPLDSSIEENEKVAIVQPVSSSQDDHKLQERIRQFSKKREEAKRRKQIEDNESLNYQDIDRDEWLANLGQPKSKKIKTSSRQIELHNEVSDDFSTTDLKIAHSTKELKNLKNNDILTLGDTDILDESDAIDVLTNEKLQKQAKLTKDLKERAEAESIKFNGRHYRGFDDEAAEEIDREEDHVMISGSVVNLSNTKKLSDEEEEDSKKLTKVKIGSLFEEFEDDEDSNVIQSKDFSKPKKSVKIKKMKKMKVSNSRSKPVSDEGMKPVILDTFDLDLKDEDEELRLALDTKRRLKQKRERAGLTPDQIANEIAKHRRNDLQVDDNTYSSYNEGVVFNDTTEFLTSLIGNSSSVDIKSDPDVKPEPENETSPQMGEVAVKKEFEDYEVAKSENADLSNVKVEKADSIPSKAETGAFDVIDEAPKFNGGLAETLNFLKARNIIHKSTESDHEQEKQRREAAKEAELLKIKISIEERYLKQELEAKKEYMNLPKAERSEVFEQKLDQRLREKNIIQEDDISPRGRKYRHYNEKSQKGSGNKLDSYNPKVSLSYRDDSGAELNTKQAFKYLSHQFHGVGPSVGKEEKRKKRAQDEAQRTTDSRII